MNTEMTAAFGSAEWFASVPEIAYDAIVPISEDDTFDQTEAPRVVREYVCGVCNGELRIVFAKSHWRVYVICEEHGNITECGRVMRSSVSIETERSLSKFKSVIRNLPDLWGSLIPPKQSVDKNLSDLGF